MVTGGGGRGWLFLKRNFGGAGQAGVVGHASGPAFRSVFYGEKD